MNTNTNVEKIQISREMAEKIQIAYLETAYYSELLKLFSQVNGPEITEYTFDVEDRCKIVRLVIPENITTIRDNAFVNCYNLEYVTIPSSVITIGKNVFPFEDIDLYFTGRTLDEVKAMDGYPWDMDEKHIRAKISG